MGGSPQSQRLMHKSKGVAMCGRLVQQLSSERIADLFGAKQLELDVGGHYNVAPTQMVSVVLEQDGQWVVSRLRWGLIPPWAPDVSIGSRMINARAETVAEKPAFKSAFRRRRCIVPADSFYEWKRTGTTKTPYVIERQDKQPLAFAGLWEVWRPKSSDAAVRSFTIITTEANQLVSAIHDRMPVILPDEVWGEWLDPANEDIGALQSLLVPFAAEQLHAFPVSPLVNNVRNDSPELLEPVAAA
jgi:putative SOS response-associated peptidase YedK